MSGRIDLHIHTTASDGQLSPAEVVHAALEIGLTAIAITDHDTTEGIAEALAAARGTSLDVIPGVEISADVPGSEVHILGYYLEYRHPDLCRKLALSRDSRLDRAQRMVAKLTRMGVPLDWDRVKQMAGDGAVGRPHIARALLEQGHVSSTDEAFARYIGRNGPAYADRHKMSPGEAVQTILAAGGLPVLAHPLRATSLIPELTRVGLAGLEVYYAGYGSDEVDFLLGLARKHGLAATGGSDFHGPDVLSANQLGGTFVPQELLEDLRACHQQRLPGLGEQER
jgi:hypothetical protein